MGKRLWFFIFLGAVILGALGLQLWTPATLETGSWGLKFNGEGEPPTGNASSAQLSQFDAVYMGDPAEKVLYLTFDAGYENGCTEKILDTLKAHQVQATFFLVGDYLERNPDLVRRMASEGHTVGNHTMNHPDMSKIQNQDAFARELGYHTVFWSLAYQDWNNNAQPSREQAFAKLLPRTHNGAIVLLHSTSATNAAILDELLTRWEEMGYRFATVDTLFEGDN